MAYYTFDDYYDIQFYNETKEALKNNGVNFREFISVNPPFHFYIECDKEPVFLNYDVANRPQERYLVNIVRPLKPSDEYIYERRESFTNKKAVNHYAVNDALRAGEKSGEGIFFTANKEEILRISKEFPRKIYYFGKHYNNKYKLFFADSLIIKNYIDSDQILVESKTFKHITDLEIKLNYDIFKLSDRLLKLSETPFVKDGRFYPVSSVVPEISGKYSLS